MAKSKAEPRRELRGASRFLWVAFLTVAAGLAAAAPEKTIIKLATVAPDGSLWHQVLKQMNADVNQATQGGVTLRIFAGGTAGDEPTTIRKMRIDQLQASALTVIGLGDIDAAFDVFSVPFFFDSYEELLYVIDKLTPTLKSRLESKGFVLVNWGHAGWVQVFSKRSVQSVDALKRVKIFTSAGDDRMVQWYKSNGFQPVALALTDALTGLQTGMIEALPTTPLAALTFQWYRHTPYMLDLGLAPLVGGTVMTRAAWEKLSQEDRARLLETAAKAEKRLHAEVPKQDETAVIEMKKRGLTVTHADPREWRQAAESFAATMRGSMVPADIFDLAQRERNAFRQRK